MARRIAAPAGLLIADLLVLELSVAVGLGLRILALPWFPVGIGPEVYLGVMGTVLLLPVGYLLAGLYPGYGLTGVERLRSRVLVTLAGFGALTLFDYLGQSGQWSRGVILATAGVAILLMPITDALARRLLLARGLWGEPAILIGPEDRRRIIADSLRKNPGLGWRPVAEADWSATSAPAVAGIALAILIPPQNGLAAPVPPPDDLPYSRVVIVPDLDGFQSLWVTVRDLGSLLGLEMRRNLLLPHNRITKRAIDIVLSAAGLILAAPVVLVCMAVLRATSRGPLFYAQRREGRDGRVFRMIKLRTMAPGADVTLSDLIDACPNRRLEWERFGKLRDDPRVLPGIGRFMRRWSLDEIPQLWNVLRGDMSLVGPRPLPDYHLARLGHTAYTLRRRVRPGLTGLWQVSGRSAQETREMERFDSHYVRNWSLWLDLHVMARTVVEVIEGDGAW